MENNKDVFSSLIERAKNKKGKKIVFPEGEDQRVIDAVKKLIQEDACNCILLGDEEIIKQKLGTDADVVEIIDISKPSDVRTKYAEALYELRKHKGLTREQAESIITKGMYYACMMVKMQDADGIVAGAVYHSADVMRPTFQIIKQRKDVTIASSCFIMEVPAERSASIGENGFAIFADCAVATYPNATELASIALASRDSARDLCGMTPRIAMLSYSTASNASDDEVIKKIKESIEIFKQQDNKTLIEGEIQADASMSCEVAQRKNPNTQLKGRANVFVFPDINAGNIAYKLVQRFSGVRAVGPIIQGLNAPVNDLSRSATAEEIYLTTIITILQTK